MFHEPLTFELPVLPKRLKWYVAIDTAKPEPSDIADSDQEVLLADQTEFIATERSIFVLIGR